MISLSGSSELLRLLGDPNRARLLHLLEGDELTVAELVESTRLPQSRVSTHLGKLKEAGLVRDRRQAQAAYYTLNEGRMPEEAARLWLLLREDTRDPLLEEDRRRARALRARTASWADTVAGQMERHYSPGRTWEAALRGLLGLAQLGEVLDVASGDGALAQLIAPRARSVHCLDISRRVVAAGRKRFAHLPSVRFELGDMHDLPFAGESFDQVLLMNSLSYAERPAAVLAEAARVLRPGGSLACVALRTHGHHEVAASYGHLQMGFEPAALRYGLERAGLDVTLCDVTARERRAPHFEILSAHASRPSREGRQQGEPGDV